MNEPSFVRVRTTCPSCGEVFGAQVPAEWSGVKVGPWPCPEYLPGSADTAQVG